MIHHCPLRHHQCHRHRSRRRRHCRWFRNRCRANCHRYRPSFDSPIRRWTSWLRHCYRHPLKCFCRRTTCCQIRSPDCRRHATQGCQRSDGGRVGWGGRKAATTAPDWPALEWQWQDLCQSIEIFFWVPARRSVRRPRHPGVVRHVRRRGMLPVLPDHHSPWLARIERNSVSYDIL